MIDHKALLAASTVAKPQDIDQPSNVAYEPKITRQQLRAIARKLEKKRKVKANHQPFHKEDNKKVTTESSSHEHKYVRHSDLGFVLWPKTDGIWHRDVARTLARIPGAIISAGFCSIYAGVARCWGESESLSIKSLPDDAKELSKQFGLSAQNKNHADQACEILQRLGWTRSGQTWVEDKAATITLAHRTLSDSWVGCGDCDVDFKCHNGAVGCIRHVAGAKTQG